MKKYKIFVTCLVIFLSGCSSIERIVVVSRDVPQKPSFVVNPASSYPDEIEFANKIEAALIGLGIKVISPPTVKEVVTTKGAAQTVPKDESNLQAAAGTSTTEKYFAYDDTDADYVIFTYAFDNRIKIIRRTDKEIIASYKISGRPEIRSDGTQTYTIPPEQKAMEPIKALLGLNKDSK